MINMEIARGYEKDTITGQMIYPCEMYQTPTETEGNTEKEELQTEQKSDNEEEE